MQSINVAPTVPLDMTPRSLFRRLPRTLAILALSGACREILLSAPVAPELPPNAEALTPPDSYADWWKATQECAGIQGDLSRITWFVIPGHASFLYENGKYDGYWWNGVHWILLAGEKVNDPLIVRHEMLHELLGRGDHPAEYFQGRCANLVACTESCREGD
jgi:hypothetical protein